jgi:tetratricopeptide (TPR) repeat protein
MPKIGLATRRLLHAVFALLLSVPCAPAQSPPQSNVQSQSPANSFDHYLELGEAALRQGRYAEAKTYFEQAERLPGADAAQVNAGIALAELQLGHYEAARQRETKVLELASNARERAEAHSLIGTAWLRESYDAPPDIQKLRAAEKEFQQAVALDPVFDHAYFDLGTALSQEGREADAASAYKKSIEAASKNPASAVGLPLARQRPAPDFTAAASNGQQISSASFRGRFVLMDYWATWCAPCIHALPLIRQLATYFPPDQFLVISIDEDSERAPWASFISQQKMDWMQVWDTNSDIYHAFGLSTGPELSIPRYVFLDPDGFILHIYHGTDHLGVMAGQIARTVLQHSEDATSRDH